jgi:hypothetical protein
MSFGDIYRVQPGQGNPPGLPPIDLPQVEAPPPPPPRKPLQITVTAPRPKSESEAYGFVKGAPPAVPSAALPEEEDQSGFVKGAPPPAPEEAPPRDVPVGESVARGAVSGLTFGAAPALAGVQAAGLDWLPPDVQKLFAGHEHEPTVGAFLLGLARLGYEQFSGDKGGTESYRRRRDEVRKTEEEATAQHPAAFIAGEVPAALAMPLGAAGGATRGGRIVAQIAGGAAGGALNETGSSISRGESAIDTAKNAGKGALTGGGFGLAGGVGGEALGELGSRAMSIYRGTRNVDEEAARRVVEALRSDYDRAGLPIGAEERRAATAAGTPTALVDYGGERTRALARSAANTSPEARSALTELTQDRFEQQSPRIGGFIRRMTGGGDAVGDLETIQAAARRANRGNYARAYAAGGRGIWSPELERLASSPAVRSAMGSAVERGQNRAVADGFGAFNPGVKVTPDGRLVFQNGKNGVPTYPNLQYWDYVQRELRDASGQAARAGRNEEAGATSALHRQLRDELDRIVPQFGTARRGAAAFFGAEDALEAGQNFVMMNASVPEARRALARMTRPERELFARGFASDLADKIEGTGDNVNVINRAFLNSGAARQKIELALGPQRARQLEALLRVEAVAQQSHRAITGNSTTVRQLAESGLAGAGAVGAVEAIKEHDYNPVHLVGAFVAAALIRHSAQRIDERVARRVGEMLASNDPAVLQRGVQVVASSPVYFEALRRATAASARIGERTIGPDNAAAGAAAGALRLIEGPPEEHPHQVNQNDWYNNPQ